MNTLLTISMITREALRVLENNLTFTKLVNRQYDDKYAVQGAKIGTTLNVRKPVRYTVSSGQALDLQNVTETQVPVVLDKQKHVDFQFSSQDLTLSIDDFSDRFVKPAVAALANQIDADGLSLYDQVWNSVGTPGTVPSSTSALTTYLNAGVYLDNNACPLDGDRSMVVTPYMQANLVDALKGLFQQATEIAQQYIKGRMGTAAGFNWHMDQNCPTHTVGPLGGTPLVVGANQTGASINSDGWTGTTGGLKKGDVITLDGVYGVNPQSRQSTGFLMQFVVTADCLADAGGALSIPISPAIVASGPFQNVSALAADNAAILTFAHASSYANKVTPQGLAFHKDAFTLVTADLQMPNNVDMAARVSDKQLGISLRLVRAYDINTDNFPCRIDVLYGWAALRPELACRVCA